MIVRIASAGSLYVHGYVFEKAGESNPGHKHTYDHFMLLSRGAVALEKQGKTTEFRCTKQTPFHLIFIERGVEHTTTALEDMTVACCLHALHSRDNPGDILAPDMIPAGHPHHAHAVPLLEEQARRQGFLAAQTEIVLGA